MTTDTAPTLPLYYGDRPAGSTMQRSSVDVPNFSTPQRPVEAAVSGRGSVQPSPGNTLGPVAHDDNDERERRPQWGPPSEDWHNYWGGRRSRDWYPEYRGPERYGISYRVPRASGVHSTPSARERGRSAVFRASKASYARFDRGSMDRERMVPQPRTPPKDEVEEYYDSDDEHTMTYEGWRVAAGKGGGGRPPRAPPTSDLDLPMRLPWSGWLSISVKGHFVATLGEFIGTTMFLMFAFAGTQVANVNNGSTGLTLEVLVYVALSFGFSLMVNVWIFFRISGGLFNPAVTLGMVLTGAISVSRAMLLAVAQITGAIFASFMVKVLFPSPFTLRTTLSNDTSLVQGVGIEVVLTAELVFTIFMLAKEKHKATFIAPIGIGMALFIAELVGVFYTGGSLNPARSFGPCVVTGTFESEHWIYWLGPAVGSVAAVLFYKLIKILEYEMANPGQDEEDPEEASRVAREQREEKLRQATQKSQV